MPLASLLSTYSPFSTADWLKWFGMVAGAVTAGNLLGFWIFAAFLSVSVFHLVVRFWF